MGSVLSKKEADEEVKESAAIARGRSLIYLWLSGFYLEKPSEDLLSRLGQKEVLTFLDGVFQDSENYKTVKDFLEKGKVDVIATEFEKLFKEESPKYVVPYASKYFKSEDEALELVKVFYDSFGLEIELKDLKSVDHIGLELAVMASLCELEADQLEKGKMTEAGIVQESERAFLGQHLARWIGRFASALEEKGGKGFYSALAHLTDELIGLDYSLFSEKV
jgi:TorA maturation chaperone TorD